MQRPGGERYREKSTQFAGEVEGESDALVEVLPGKQVWPSGNPPPPPPPPPPNTKPRKRPHFTAEESPTGFVRQGYCLTVKLHHLLWGSEDVVGVDDGDCVALLEEVGVHFVQLDKASLSSVIARVVCHLAAGLMVQ